MITTIMLPALPAIPLTIKPPIMKNFLFIMMTCYALLQAETTTAQLTVNAQLRTRGELRDGQGAPLPESAKPAFFISQRSRLFLLYTGYRIKLGVTGQDVRVWGQDVSTINRTTTADNNGFMLHEAWAEIVLT